MLFVLAGGCAGPTTNTPVLNAAKDIIEVESTTLPSVLVRRAPRATGDLDADAAGRALARRWRDFEACHEAAGGDRIGRGVVYVLLDVAPGGVVEHVTVGHSDVRAVRFETCLRGVLRETTLPAATTSSLVQAHLIFGAEGIDEGRQMLRAYRSTRAPTRETTRSAAVPLVDLRHRVQSCYERALRRRPSLRGRLVLELTVAEDGEIAEAEVSEDGLDGVLDRCVLGAIRGLRLEVASASRLQYPVILEPGR